MQRCVPNGPFSSWIIHLPSGTSVSRQDRCLSRQLSPQIASQWLLKTYEDQILAKPDFGHMTLALEGDTLGGMGLHGGGHFSVGGSAGDVYTSNTGIYLPYLPVNASRNQPTNLLNTEPLFYLHHTNMDRIWARWQAANPALRLKDISGSIKPRSPLLNPGQGLPAGNVTLEFKVELGKLGKAVTMAEIMDTKGALVGGTGGVLCYEYV